MSIEIKLLKKGLKLKKPVLVEGLPGLGLVGTIAASYLVQKLDMKLLGYIKGSDFPPLIAIHNFKPYFPVRLYYSKKHNLIVLLSEFVIPMAQVTQFTKSIEKFAKKMNVSKIISLGSISIKDKQDTVYGITTDDKLSDLMLDANVEMIKEGATTGVTAMLLADSTINKIPTTSLLAEAHQEYADPKGATMVLEVLNDILDMKINLQELVKEAKNIDKKMKNVINKGEQIQQQYKKLEGKHGPPVPSMYG